jgi:hypothetical protein
MAKLRTKSEIIKGNAKKAQQLKPKDAHKYKVYSYSFVLKREDVKP